MPTIKRAIEVHKDELVKGADIVPFSALKDYVMTAHRDDHYMFILQKDGHFLWELDFNKIFLDGPSVCFVSPGQVHHYLEIKSCEGWLVFCEAALVPPQYRTIFDNCLNIKQSVSVKSNDPLFNIIALLEESLALPTQPLNSDLIRSQTETLAGLIASRILQSQNHASSISGTKYNTVTRFKQLVTENKTKLKLVQEYASLLNITPLYLNEIVKQATGFTASYWINQGILLEAKRMLYYTSLDVKQIAYELGYEDHAYFSRFFKKNSGMTALEFRNSKPLIIQ